MAMRAQRRTIDDYGAASMFESAELGHRIDRKTYTERVPALRQELLEAQYRLGQERDFPVLILISGVDGAGKGETVNLLNAWMDPRHIVTEGFGPPSQEERERPAQWRFWRLLPPQGKIGIFFGSWYTQPIVSRVEGDASTADLDRSIQQIIRFERMLTNEGVLLLKFWFHLSKERQRKRLKGLEKDPATRWRVTDTDWARFKKYDKFRKWSEHTLRHTSTGNAPWYVVEGTDHNFRSLTVAQTLLEAIRHRMENSEGDAQQVKFTTAPLVPPIDNLRILRTLPTDAALSRKQYDEQLLRYQGRLNLLTREPRFRNHSVILVFEGNDAAGKGSSIRRITAALDARRYRIVPVAAPTEEERAQPYLWRFWRHVPGRGGFTIFDRSWYGRVLVERVEALCPPASWMRAYSEINDFEEQLIDNRTIVVKFWLAISKAEQLKRFQARENTPFKRFKITDEDWRNREKWDEYETAVCDMVDRTSTEFSPWHLVPANDKRFARVDILKTVCKRIEQALA